jgi:hypothetical protein
MGGVEKCVSVENYVEIVENLINQGFLRLKPVENFKVNGDNNRKV